VASQTGQLVDEFVEALLRRVAEADVPVDRGVPVFRPRPGAPVLTVEDVDGGYMPSGSLRRRLVLSYSEGDTQSAEF